MGQAVRVALDRRTGTFEILGFSTGHRRQRTGTCGFPGAARIRQPASGWFLLPGRRGGYAVPTASFLYDTLLTNTWGRRAVLRQAFAG